MKTCGVCSSATSKRLDLNLKMYDLEIVQKGIKHGKSFKNKRIIVVGAKKENIKYNDAEEIPITAMINPIWKKISEDTDIQYEGCMSVPVIRGKVERYKNIELTYFNENGEKIVRQVNGFFARLVQHECDHLDGIVFLEKVKEHNGFATVDSINKYNLRDKERIQA